MAKPKYAKPRTVRLEADLDSRIEVAAEQDHRTASSLIRHILATALEDRRQQGAAA
jgi:hypothetical protein